MLFIEQLDKRIHDRERFVSSNEMLNEYLKKYSSQDRKNNLTATYVAVKENSELPKRIYGYFSINSFSLTYQTGSNLQMEPYGYLPAILIGRLAIAKNQDYLRGYQLLWGAINYCVQVGSKIGVSIIVVDPIDDKAKRFYLNQGFQFTSINSDRMYLSIQEIKAVLAQLSPVLTTAEGSLVE